MTEEYVLSPHARKRIGERMTLTPEEVVERLHSDTFAIVCTTITDPVYRYTVMWDEGVDEGILVILRFEKGTWVIVTVFETMPHHRRAHGVVVMPHHLWYAEKAHRRLLLERQQLANGGDAVRLYMLLRSVSPGSFRLERRRLGVWPWGEFSSQYGSLESLLLSPQLAELATTIVVPAGSAVEVELYRSVHQKPRMLLERMVINEGE